MLLAVPPGMILAMRKTLAFVGVTLLLSACGGSSAEITCESAYWDGTIGTCLPNGWRVVDRDELDERGIPGEVLVAFQSEEPYAGQFATVTVTREILAQDLTSPEYSEASVASVKGLPGYTEVDEQTVSVDGEDVLMHIFTAQPQEDQPESRFYQVSAVSNNEGYTFTGATPVSVSDELEAQVQLILSSASFQEAKEE